MEVDTSELDYVTLASSPKGGSRGGSAGTTDGSSGVVDSADMASSYIGMGKYNGYYG